MRLPPASPAARLPKVDMRLWILRAFCASVACTPSLHELEKGACPFLKALYLQLRAEITPIHTWFCDGHDRMVSSVVVLHATCTPGLGGAECPPPLPSTAPTARSSQSRVHLGYVKVLSCPVQKTRLKRAQLGYRFFSSHRISPRIDVVPCREIQREWA